MTRQTITALICAFALLVLFALPGCSVTRHQKGGKAGQSLSSPVPVFAAPIHIPASQTIEQPENPQGESRQNLARVVTTVDPVSGVITSTSEKAETTIGGSQDLAKIVKEKVGADHLRNLAAALCMGLVAWLMRREWPYLAGALGIGAVFTAFFGLWIALGFAGFVGGGMFVYFAARARIGIAT